MILLCSKSIHVTDLLFYWEFSQGFFPLRKEKTVELKLELAEISQTNKLSYRKTVATLEALRDCYTFCRAINLSSVSTELTISTFICMHCTF